METTGFEAQESEKRKESFQDFRQSRKPLYRRLRGYSFDPSLSVQMDTAIINETVYRVPWEEGDQGDDGLMPGPVGEYLEIIDFDPASGCFYSPLNLNDPYLLAQDGLSPAEANPQFHQQMVYAVAMTTIANFERALGRVALWAPRKVEGGGLSYEFVRRLRVYPHALREANAYYSPEKKALLFGYFSANAESSDRYLPGGTVFTCLSHDIITHETSHALLDGMHRRFIEPSNPDALAFHEAFADIVALFQHFSFPTVLRHQIARNKGNLAIQNLLGELAQQFGEAVGNYGALRSAIGAFNPASGQWEPNLPDPREYETETEPHARGAILLAAVFDAFLSIYNSRIADLLRVAGTSGSSHASADLHPDLVNRLADEAAKSAKHVLNVCIRALDYCPPVDINFGDYLRAIVTADLDLVPDDDKGYRVAFIEAFRRRGIYPRGVRGLSSESLCWESVGKYQNFFQPLSAWLREKVNRYAYFNDRGEVYRFTEELKRRLHIQLREQALDGRDLNSLGEVTGMTFELNATGLRQGEGGVPRFEVHSMRPAQRVGPDGDSLNQLVISMTQSRDIGAAGSTMVFRGGCTLILDLNTMLLRYAISKSVTDEDRLNRHLDYHRQMVNAGSLRGTYFGALEELQEPLALLHGGTNFGRP